MSGKTLMNQATMGHCMALAALLALSACDENGKFSFPGGGDAGTTETAATAPLTETVERDVEAPEVFSVTETGLWDGRPSLGGVWVAHPDVTDPERVIIRNEVNGQFVIGALFRRERDNPGPALQVSSDAAESLGLLAGAPGTLNVVALRREEGPVEVTPVAASEGFDAPTTESAIAIAEISATSLDDPAAAAPAIPAATDDPGDVAINAAAAIAAVTAATGNAAVSAAPVAAVPAATASGLEKPFIQIGIFSIEGNANATAEKLRGDGLSANVIAQQSQGRSFWRVIVGPAPTAADRTAVLDKVKALGFTDAYAVSN